MGKLVDDLMHLEQDVKHMHDDVEHIIKVFEGFGYSPSVGDIRDHLKGMDARLHDVMSHIGHIRMETETK